MKLTSVSNRNELASLLHIPTQTLTGLLYFKTDNEKYRYFFIPKHNGGKRLITAPTEPLMTVQRTLARILTDDYEEILNENHINSKIAHGFLKNRSILTNATVHENKRYVLNLDLENFFDSFHFGRVRGYFIKNRYFKLPEDIATLIAQVACCKGKLPQGAPTSPIITNLICEIFDYRILSIARRFHLNYTRYADDLTFSTNEKEFPKVLTVFLKTVRAEIEHSGFKVNIPKTHFQQNFSRQIVTGIIVNRKINVPREFYKDTRAMAYSLYKVGQFTIDNRKGTLAELEGRFSYIYEVDSFNEKQNKHNLSYEQHGTSKEKLSSHDEEYRKFIFYKYCIGNDRPVIITEGKTDSLYLKAALKSLYRNHPWLISRTSDKGYSFRVAFLHRRPLFQKLLNFPEDGADGISRFYNDFVLRKNKSHKWNDSYYDYFIHLSNRYPTNPVFLLYDHEMTKGMPLKKFFDLIGHNKENELKEFDQNCFLKLRGNFYLLTLPEPIHRSRPPKWEIEELFDNKTLNHQINGRSFALAKEKVGREVYDKYMFANYVIRDYKSIDFSNFDPLFKNIETCIADYYQWRNNGTSLK